MNTTNQLMQKVIYYCHKQVGLSPEEALLWSQCEGFAKAAQDSAKEDCNNAQRLADALKATIGILPASALSDHRNVISHAYEALAQYKESPSDADALEALDQLEDAQDE